MTKTHLLDFNNVESLDIQLKRDLTDVEQWLVSNTIQLKRDLWTDTQVENNGDVMYQQGWDECLQACLSVINESEDLDEAGEEIRSL